MYLKQCLPYNSFVCFISFGIFCIMLFNVVHARGLNLWRHFSVNQMQKASLQVASGLWYSAGIRGFWSCLPC